MSYHQCSPRPAKEEDFKVGDSYKCMCGCIYGCTETNPHKFISLGKEQCGNYWSDYGVIRKRGKA